MEIPRQSEEDHGSSDGMGRRDSSKDSQRRMRANLRNDGGPSDNMDSLSSVASLTGISDCSHPLKRRALLSCLASTLVAGCFTRDSDDGYRHQSSTLVPPDQDTENNFGWSVALTDRTALVGAPEGDNGYGAGSSGGVVWVFRRTESTWQQTQKLVASDAPDVYSSHFGRSIGIDGSTFLVGAAESVYVFTQIADGQSWTAVQKFLPDSDDTPFSFGEMITLTNDTAFIGAPWSEPGIVYVFERSTDGNTWHETQRLTADDSSPDGLFGTSAGLGEDVALVGNPWAERQNDEARGAVYVFEEDAAESTWRETQILTASNPDTDDWFGHSVTLVDDIAVVGAPKAENEHDVTTGAIYLFERIADGTWKERQKLDPGNKAVKGMFGATVEQSENTLLVGAPNRGIAYLCYRNDPDWRLSVRFAPNDSSNQGRFGWSLTLLDDTALVGAPGEESFTSVDDGVAYIFEDIDSSHSTGTKPL